MRRLIPISLLALAACGSGPPQSGGNDAQRQAELIARQRDAMQNEAESNVSAAEQALEKEGAAIFENRAALLNESAPAEQANMTTPTEGK